MRSEIINTLKNILEKEFKTKVKRGIIEIGELNTYSKFPLICINTDGSSIESIPFNGTVNVVMTTTIRFYGKSNDYYGAIDDVIDRMISALTRCDHASLLGIVDVDIVELLNDGTIDKNIFAISVNMKVKYQMR